MKKIITGLTFLVLVATGCLKNTGNNFADLPAITPNTVQFAPAMYLAPYSVKYGTGTISTNYTPADTTPVIYEFYGELQSANASLSSTTMTIAKTPSVINSYNANATAASTAFRPYQVLPDSAFQILTPTAVTNAEGKVTFKVKIFPQKIPANKKFGLPISITSATGGAVPAANRSTLILGYALLVNPYGASYSRDYKRWNGLTATGTPTTANVSIIAGVPIDQLNIRFQSGYGTQNGVDYRYVLSFTDNGNGTFGNFTVKIDPQDAIDFNTSSGITLITDATIISVDPVLGIFKFTFQVTNGSGAPRTFIDTFTKQ